MNKPIYEPLERRPIASRNTRWANAITQFLIDLKVSPNAISILGMLAAITAGIFFYSTHLTSDVSQRTLWFFAAILCQIRLLCNLLDGMVAVKRGIASAKGELFNEVPDRVSDAVLFIGLGHAASSNIALGYGAALVSVFVAYVRASAKSIGAPNDFCGPMAKPQRMALATILAVYMAVSPLNLRLPWGEPKVILLIVIFGGALTALRRLKRAAYYLERPAK